MIFIKCSEKDCKMINRVERSAMKSHMLKGGKPIITCKGCKTKLEIMPVKAVCHNPSCGKGFRYYDFLLNEKEPIVKCPHCQGRNRMIIKEIPEQLKKAGNL